MPDVRSRREQTRSALIAAAQEILAERGENVSVLEIVERAGVSVGSFYNHFGTKDALWDAAAQDALERYTAWLIEATAQFTDPLEVLAYRARIYARLPETHPINARMLINPRAFRIMSTLTSPEARENTMAVLRAMEHEGNHDSAFLVATGMALAMIFLGLEGPVDPELIDDAATDLMVIAGMDRAAAHELCHRPLPVLPAAF